MQNTIYSLYPVPLNAKLTTLNPRPTSREELWTVKIQITDPVPSVIVNASNLSHDRRREEILGQDGELRG
jgi:hypothetical protein